MDIFLKEDLKELVQRRNGKLVSIYLPMYRAGAEVQQNRIRLKNTLNEAEKELLGIGRSRTEIEAILQPAVKLLHDDIFLNHQSDGLALFLTDDWSCYYRLPETFEETLIVTDRFHIKPLIPFISNNLRFFLLTLSLDEVQLYHGDRYHLEKIESDGFPKSMDEALRFDDPERELQFHTQTDSPVATGARPAEFHGHGVSGETRKKDRVERYLHKVTQGVYGIIGDQVAPLLLAGVDYLLAIYREVNNYSHLISESIVGNTERKSSRELHDEAKKIVEPVITQEREQLVSQYHALRDAEKASESLAKIIPAAYQGRVKGLFVAKDREVWGNFDPESLKVRISEERDLGTDDLLDLAVVHTFIYGGEIYVVSEGEVPGSGVASAVFRY
jgi:hypothetical protein